MAQHGTRWQAGQRMPIRSRRRSACPSQRRTPVSGTTWHRLARGGTGEKKEAPVGVEPTMADLQSGTGGCFAREWQRFCRSDHYSDHYRSRRPGSCSGGRGLVEPAARSASRHPRHGRGEQVMSDFLGLTDPRPTPPYQGQGTECPPTQRKTSPVQLCASQGSFQKTRQEADHGLSRTTT